MNNKHLFFAIITVIAFFTNKADAQVKPNSLFSDNMVLQRNIKVPVWGTAANCDKVSVEFNGQKLEADVKDGKWFLSLKQMKECSAPLLMTIKCDVNTLIIQNILVGEVWLCGGQSNMERQLGPRPPQKPLLNWEAEVAGANYPEMREFALPHFSDATVEVQSVNAKWVICSPETAMNFSAVGYYFGKDLLKYIKVPIGLIHSSWGGSPAEKWTSREALESDQK